MDLPRFAAFLAACINLQPFLAAQVRAVSPSAVIDLSQAAPEAGLQCPSITDVDQRGASWAALLWCSGTRSMVVWGGEHPGRATLAGRFDRIVLDRAHNMILSGVRVRSNASFGFTGVTVLDSDGHIARSFLLNTIGATPIIIGDEVRWNTPRGIFSGAELSMDSALPSQDQEEKDKGGEDGLKQASFIAALRSGGYARIGNLSERISIFGGRRDVIGSRLAELDDAYKLIGVPARPPDPASGRTRIIWAAGSPEGLFYICLSDTPMSGPANIAILDPATGRVRGVLQAELPRTDRRKSEPFNPKGVITPTLGAVGDHILIADPEAQIVAIY